MKKLQAFLLALTVGLLLNGVAFADISTTDLYELNNATPGLSKVSSNAGTNSGTGLGNLLKGNAITGKYGGTTADYSGNCTTTSASTTISGYRTVLWYIPASGYSCPLGNGTPGQRITIIKANSGTVAGKITPTTKFGFTDITLTNQGEGVNLTYVDDTSGWVPNGVFGGSTSVVPKVNP